MTIQVVNMKYTGQLIITDLANVWENEEAKNERKPPVCFSFAKPYVLEIDSLTDEGYNLRMSKWNPYTDEAMFQVGFDLVTTISEPKAAIIEAYNNRLSQDSKDSTPDSLKDGKETTKDSK